MKKIIISVVIVAALLLVAAFVPIVEAEFRYTETYLEDEPYEVAETYYEDEPYEVTEAYTETVSVEMEILEHRLERDFLLFVRGRVKHTGDEILHWTDVTIRVEYEIEDMPGRTFTQPGGLDPVPATFKPGEIRNFEVLVQDGTIRYEITSPTTTKTVEGERTVTKYRQVEKERTVTKYRQVERERLVIEYRTVPIFEHLRSRFQD